MSFGQANGETGTGQNNMGSVHTLYYDPGDYQVIDSDTAAVAGTAAVTEPSPVWAS